MSSDTQFKASDSASEVSHAQQNTPNINVLDLFKGAQQGPNDSVGTAKNYLPSLSLTGDDFNLSKLPSMAMPGGPLTVKMGGPIEQGQPIGKIQSEPAMPRDGQPMPLGQLIEPPIATIQTEPAAMPRDGQPMPLGVIEPLGQPIQPLEQPSVIGTVSPPVPIEQPSVIGSVSPPAPSESQFPQTAPLAPEVGLSGFDQKAPDTSTNPLGQLGYGLKGLVGADPTLQDQLTKKELSDLTPQQLQEYNTETAEMRSRETLAYAGPMAPLNTPMHNLVSSRVAQDERQIANKVQSDMSPTDRKELQAEWNTYTAPHTVNPAGGPAGYPVPKPGPEIQAYYQQVEEETEKYLNQS